MSKEINVLALVKGDEQYLFLFDDSNRVETLRLLGRYAADPELSFSWYDAAVLSQKIRETMHVASTEAKRSEPSFEWTSLHEQGSDPSLTTTDSKSKGQIRFQFPDSSKRSPEELT